MNNFVINVPTTTNRQTHIRQQFQSQNIEFAFFDAVQPEDLTDCMAQHLPQLANVKHLRDVEKACLMSHFLLWKYCVQQKWSHITIFEDDIILGENAAKWLAENDWTQRLEQDKAWLLRLETFLMPTHTDLTNIPDYENRAFLRLKSTHHGTAAYVISLAAAEYWVAWLSRLPENQFDALDELIFSQHLHNPSLPVYQISPAVCIQEFQLNQENSVLQSTLGNARFGVASSSHEVKRQRSFSEKIQREWLRLKKKMWGKPSVIPFK